VNEHQILGPGLRNFVISISSITSNQAKNTTMKIIVKNKSLELPMGSLRCAENTLTQKYILFLKATISLVGKVLQAKRIIQLTNIVIKSDLLKHRAIWSDRAKLLVAKVW
jgi:hypothetical protein